MLRKIGQDFGLPDLPGQGGSSDNFGLPENDDKQIEQSPNSGLSHLRPHTVPVSARPPLSSSFSSIKELQQAIIEFANVASASDVTSMKGNQEGQEQGASGEYLGGSDPFGNFLAQHVKSAPGSADQYVNTDLDSKQRGKTEIEDTNLRGIINDIKTIGSPGKDKAPDGIWKQRTQHALQQILKLMMTIKNMATTMNIPIEGLDKTVDSFAKNVPESYTSISDMDKGKLAPTLTAELKELSSLFSAFRTHVLSDKDLSPYINQKKSFVSYQKGAQDGRSTLNEDEKKIFTGNVPIPEVQLAKSSVSLYDLDNMTNFSRLMQRSGRNPKDPAQVKNTLAELSRALGGEAQSVPEIQSEPGY